jgi:hypothetical protein
MIFARRCQSYIHRRIVVRERTMQAAYALTRLILFGFGWSIAAGLALAADELLPGVKWPVLAILAALWTFICALYVAGEARSRDLFDIRSAEIQNGPESL